MAKQKKFDPVTVIGLTLALFLFFAGQYYINQRNQAARVAWEAAEKARLQAEADKKAATPPDTTKPATSETTPTIVNGTPTPTPTPTQKNGDTPPATADDDKDPADAGDISVVTPNLDLTFTARGATLKSASLPGEYKDPAIKTGTGALGLELLDEIEKGKRSFGLQYFEFGSPTALDKDRVIYSQATGATRGLDHRVWKLEKNSGAFDLQGDWQLVYSTTVQQKFKVEKKFTINNNTRHVTVDIAVTNLSKEPFTYSYGLIGPAGILLDGPAKNPKGGAYVYIAGELASRDAPTAGQTAVEPDLLHVDATGAAGQTDESKLAVSRQHNLWGCLKNRFYMSMFISVDPQQLVKLKCAALQTDPNSKDLRLAEPNVLVLGIRKLSPALEPDKTSGNDRYALYLGPANEGPLQDTETALKPAHPLYMPIAIQYCDIFGWRWPRVDWLARQMLLLFQGIYKVFGNYGLAVILLTLVIKLALHPLQRKMMVSMDKFQKLQPEIKKIQEKYKNQTSTEAKQKMYLEQQDLMKKAGANPAAGCLPMFIQIPVFSALYGIFNRAFEIRGAEFLWIKDLSQQDAFAMLGSFSVNLLPILYMGVTILQTKLTPTPKSDDPQQEMNRKMMMFMPIMFSVMFYAMPSGLVLYFAASAVFGMLETWYIKKFLIKDGTPPAGGPLVKPA